MSDRVDEIRSRVLALLDAAGAGDAANWRDRNAGYWIGVEEGRYDEERKVARLQRENARLRSRLARVLRWVPNWTWKDSLDAGRFRRRGRVWSRRVPGGRRNER